MSDAARQVAVTSRRRPRMLVITSKLPPAIGGEARYAHHLSCALERIGARVTVLVRDRDAAVLRRRLALDVISIDTKSGGPRPFRFRRIQREVFSLLDQHQPDHVLFAHPVTSLGRIYSKLRDRGIPFHMAIHGFSGDHLVSAKGRERLSNRNGLGIATGLVANSRFTESLLVDGIGIPPERIRTIYMGVDPSFAEVSPALVEKVRARIGAGGRTVMLSVGRLVRRKNFAGVIEMLPRLLEDTPDLLYVVVGDGPEQSQLVALAEELGVSDSVRLLPACDPTEVGAYYRAADLFIMIPVEETADGFETFGFVYAEANSCGLPIIGHRLQGIPEAVEDGRTGFLVEPGDTSGLLKVTRELIASPELRQRMGEAGRQNVRKRFDWDQTAREVIDFVGAGSLAPDA